ncbi:MAG: hypothetical protein WEC75_12215 [Dehalococcoidia bacterium]
MTNGAGRQQERPNAKYDHVYVIFRVDEYESAPFDPEQDIVVKTVLRNKAAAVREVGRLNGLRPDIRERYFWKLGRLER